MAGAVRTHHVGEGFDIKFDNLQELCNVCHHRLDCGFCMSLIVGFWMGVMQRMQRTRCHDNTAGNNAFAMLRLWFFDQSKPDAHVICMTLV